jgi:hypothetical protein
MREFLRRASALQIGDDIETSGAIDGMAWCNITAIERAGAELTFSFRDRDIVRRRPDDFIPIRRLGEEEPELKVGTIVMAKWSCTETLCPACKPGEIGVCFLITEPIPTNAHTNYFLFEKGSYGGFSHTDVYQDFLWVTEEICSSVATYQFGSWDRLERDYKRGVFKPAFDVVRNQAAKA